MNIKEIFVYHQSMYMYHWDVFCSTEIIVQFNVLFVFCLQRKIEQVKISCLFWRNRYAKNIEKYVSY